MLHIGCHLSAAKGYLSMGQTAVSIGANTFQFFTRNPRGGNARALDLADVAAYRAFAEENGLGPVVAHAPYTLNGCSKDENIRDFALRTMRDDLERMEQLPGNLYNFHPGSATGQDLDTAVGQIAAMLNQVLREDLHTTVLLETMAGKGSEVGRTFEELRAIIDRVTLGDRLGVCLDTCHVWDAGYDVQKDLDGVLTEFDKVLGLGRLMAVHLNDSQNERGSRKDRHARLGEGKLGAEALARLATHPALAGLPLVLETPNELPGYAEEIARVKEWWGV